MLLKNKKIILGVTGSISAYKSAELLRLLQKQGAKVRVTLTKSASEFIGKLTFKALTGENVLINWNDGETGLEHINWGRWADALVISPASANTIAKLRIGIADNFLTSLALAFDKRIVLAPAMNTKMYLNEATQENLEILKKRGYLIVEPIEGHLACDEVGIGKLADIEDIFQMVLYAVYPKPLERKKIVITAGGTREYFDPIRYISNNSSGYMGYTLASIAHALGGDVTLISAPTCLKPPYGVKLKNVVSALDMYETVLEDSKDADIIIMNSAVADFRPKTYSKSKLKKDKESSTINLEKNPDILLELGKRKKNNQILIGFAAESDNIRENALKKLERKNLDMIVANPLDVFNQNYHQGFIYLKNGEVINIPPMPKESSALFIWEQIIGNFFKSEGFSILV